MFPFLRRAYLKRLISMNAVRKGLLGGSPLWRGVWLVLTARRLWARVSKKGEAPIALSEPLPEGDAWTMVHVPEQSKRGRGEGRKYVVGPKRRAPRASALAPAALAAAGAKILEAPDADRINEILGARVVEDPPPSRAKRRAAKRDERRTRTATKKDAAALEKAAKADAKTAARQAKADAKTAARQAKADAKTAARQAKADAKTASRQAKAERKGLDRGVEAVSDPTP